MRGGTINPVFLNQSPLFHAKEYFTDKNENEENNIDSCLVLNVYEFDGTAYAVV